MVGAQQPTPARKSMYGTTIPNDGTTNEHLETLSDRIHHEIVLDTLLNTPYPLTAANITDRTTLTHDIIHRHLEALTTAGIATTHDDGYTAHWNKLPLDNVVETGDTAEVFLLEARDKEYRQWFDVDTPYDATLPENTDVETAIAALDQWFGVRKRLHQLADTT